MHIFQWSVFISISFQITFGTLAKQEKLIDDEDDSRSTITFEPAVVHALKQPHSLDDFLQREEFRDELDSLDIITSSFKESSDQYSDSERLNAEEIVKRDDPICADLPQLLDDEPTPSIYSTIFCKSALCTNECPEDFKNDIEKRFKVENQKDDGQEPFCDEFIGSDDLDEEIVQAISNAQKRVKLVSALKCKISPRALVEALKNRYSLPETLQYSAIYWLTQNEIGNAVYCLRNFERLTESKDQIRDVQFIISQLYFHAKRSKGSIRLLTLLAEKPPSNAIIYRVLASRHLYNDNCSAAVEYYEKAFDLDPHLFEDMEFKNEWDFCRCRLKVISLLGKEQKKLQRQLDELNAYNDAMERELQLHSLINSRTITKQKYSDSWLAFSHIKFGPLPGLKCSESMNARKHKRLQCKITNLLDYFGTTVKKLEDYRSGLEDLSDHDAFLASYDSQRQEQEAKISKEMETFLKNIKQYVGLKIEDPFLAGKSLNDRNGSWFSESNKSNRPQIIQGLCKLKVSSQSTDSDLVYMSLEKRGYPVHDLLNKYLNLSPTTIHPLPWDLPYCKSLDWNSFNQSILGELASKYHFTGIDAEKVRNLWDNPGLYTAESELNPYLAKMMGVDTSELMLGDFGQRVRTLMEFRIGSDWLHRELATMLFRSLGLFREALECITQNLSNLDEIKDKKSEDITLSQLFGVLEKGGVLDEKERLAVLMLIYSFNQHEFKEPSLCFQISKRIKSGGSIDFLWQGFDIDSTYQPVLNGLKDYYCNAKSPSITPIQYKYQPICCWKSEHDVYCFNKSGSCFKISTSIVNDKVVHDFISFRCSGPYVARSFSAPPLAHFVVGFLKPATEFRNQMIQQGIETFLAEERRLNSKENKKNTKKVLPLDYGGFSARRIAQFLPHNEEPEFPLETKAYVDIDYELKSETNRETKENVRFYQMWNGDLIELDESYQNKEKLAINFANWSDIIRADIYRPKKIPIPDPVLVKKGMETFKLPNEEGIRNFCAKRELKHLLEPVSTYLSISVKGVNIDSLIDREAKISTSNLEEPFCLPKTVDADRLFHSLPGTYFSERIKLYKPEKALRDALLSLGGPHDTVAMIGARLNAAIKRLGNLGNLKKGDGHYWALANVAALYWRVKGDSHSAITCLVQSLDYSPKHTEDVAAASLANIYHQTGFLNSALVAGHYALQASRGSVVGVHFTLANIYASMGEHKLAEQFYFSTIAIQSNFQAAKDRILALQCQMIESSTDIGTEFIKAFNNLRIDATHRELVVFGAGSMAGCLVEAFVNRGCFKQDEIVLITQSEISAEKWAQKGFERALSIEEYLKDNHASDKLTSRIVILGIKPQKRVEFFKQLQNKNLNFNADIVCSIMAGVTHSMLKNELYTHKLYYGPIVRLTPNVCCKVGSGLTLLYSPDTQINDIVIKLLNASGDVKFVEESYFNASSAIAGSGPAWAFLVAEALADGGVLAGLQRDDANKMAAQMLKGAAEILLRSGKHPGELKDRVCSSGGTTIAGVRQLEKGGVRSAFIEAVMAAKERADELAS